MDRLTFRTATPPGKKAVESVTGPALDRPVSADAGWERRLVLVLVVAITVFAGFFASPIALRRVGVNGDMGMHFLPIRGLYARYLRTGQDFDWFPELFGGYLMTGEGQHGPYHPLHLLMYRWMPLDVAFATEVFLPVLVLGVGLIVYLRRYVNTAGACMGGLLGGFATNFVVHMQQPCITQIIAHVPWMMLAIDGVVQATQSVRRMRAVAAIALVTGSQVLLGHPQALWFSLLTGSLYGLFVLIARRKDWKAWAGVVAGVSLGLGIGAVQLLATVELLATTDRTVANPTALAYPTIECRQLPGLFAPSMVWGDIFPTYFGAVSMVLACWWLTAHRLRFDDDTEAVDAEGKVPSASTWRYRPAWQLSLWATLATLLMAWMSLGREGYLYRLQMLLPLVGRFRGPARFLMVSQICFAILAAVAFARLVHLVRTDRHVPRPHLILPWIPAVIAVALIPWQLHSGIGHADLGSFKYSVFPGALLFGGAALAVTAASRGPRMIRQVGLVSLCLLAAVDVAVFCVGNQGVGKIYWRRLPTYSEYLAGNPLPPVPPEAANGRLVHEGNPGDMLKRINPYLLMGYRAANGNAGLYVRRSVRLASVNALRVAETAWYWQPPNDICRIAGMTPPPGGGWCAIPNPLPRARLVTEARYSDAPGEDIDRIDVDRTALTSRPIALPPSLPGRVDRIEERPGHLALEVQVPAEQLLVLTESYHRAWHVRCDGKPIPPERVNGDFLGCLVAAGRHRIEFDFRSDVLRLGKFLSLACLSIVTALAIGLPPVPRRLYGWHVR